MVAYAPNLSARNQKRGSPSTATGKVKPGKAKAAKAKPLDRGTHLPTRELKVHINILNSFLAQPTRCAGLAAKDLAAMTARLSMLRKELAKRDELENRPLTGDALLDKLRTAAPRAAQHGMRVQLQA